MYKHESINAHCTHLENNPRFFVLQIKLLAKTIAVSLAERLPRPVASSAFVPDHIPNSESNKPTLDNLLNILDILDLNNLHIIVVIITFIISG